MTSVQLPLDVDSGLPMAFIDRWRELGGPSISGESCSVERGHYTFEVLVAGARGCVGARFVFIRRRDVRACADELFAKVRQ